MNRVTRSMEATTPGEAARVARQRIALPSGWWGVVLLVATEAALFGTLLASYFYLRFKSSVWPQGEIAEPKLFPSTVLTAVLVLTSAPIAYAAATIRRGSRFGPQTGLAAALVIALVYLIVQAQQYLQSWRQFTADENAYASLFYTLTGLHAAHVVVGVAINLWTIVLVWSRSKNRYAALEAVALYWHAVNVLAVAVFLTVYVSPLL